MSNHKVRACLIGAGYISEFHKKAIDRIVFAEIVGVCDINRENAVNLADETSIKIFTDLSQALSPEHDIDIFHILTPPETHFSIAKLCLEAGKSVLLEKPATTSLNDLKLLLDIEKNGSAKIFVNHNFLSSSPIRELKEAIKSRQLGSIKSINLKWAQPLTQAKNGPWNLWMLKDPENNLYETGSHLLASLSYLLDSPVSITNVIHSTPRILSNGAYFIDRWEIQGTQEEKFITISIDSSDCFQQHIVEVTGLFGIGIADVNQNLFIHKRHTGKSYDQEILSKNLRTGMSYFSQGLKTYLAYVASKFSLRYLGSPYEGSITSHIKACYEDFLELSSNPYTRLASCINVYENIQQIELKTSLLGQLQHRTPLASEPPEKEKRKQEKVEVLVVGGSGFIGSRLVKKLLDQGMKTGALVRNDSSLSHLRDNPNLTILKGDYRDIEFLDECLSLAERVIHMAVSHSNSRAGYQTQFVSPTIELIKACDRSGISQFIYIGTIDSLPLHKSEELKQEARVDEKLHRRNNYAYAKGMIETYLQSRNFETMEWCIIRPGIVVGAGGPIEHPGVAEWNGIGQCHFWGKGDNPIPIVLVDDVCEAVVSSIANKGVSGRSFNLVSEAKISAKDYIKVIEEALEIKITSFERGHGYRYLIDKLKWVFKMVSGHPDRHRIPSYKDWTARGQYATFDLQKTKAALGWEPESSETLIAQTIGQAARVRYKDDSPLISNEK